MHGYLPEHAASVKQRLLASWQSPLTVQGLLSIQLLCQLPRHAVSVRPAPKLMQEDLWTMLRWTLLVIAVLGT